MSFRFAPSVSQEEAEYVENLLEDYENEIFTFSRFKFSKIMTDYIIRNQKGISTLLMSYTDYINISSYDKDNRSWTQRARQVYRQHTKRTHEGLEGFTDLMKGLAQIVDKMEDDYNWTSGGKQSFRIVYYATLNS